MKPNGMEASAIVFDESADAEQRDTIRGMLRDWEAATPEQRRAAGDAAALAAEKTEDRLKGA